MMASQKSRKANIAGTEYHVVDNGVASAEWLFTPQGINMKPTKTNNRSCDMTTLEMQNPNDPLRCQRQKSSAVTNLRANPVQYLILLSCVFFLGLVGCATREARVAPVALPDSRGDSIRIEEVRLTATAYANPEEAQAAIGFDALGAGLLPVQLVIDNQDSKEALVNVKQTFLIDREGQAWPALTNDQACERAEKHLELGETAMGTVKPGLLLGAAGALAGAAVGAVTGTNVGEAAGKGAVIGATAGVLGGGTQAYMNKGEEIRRDVTQKSLSSSGVRPGELIHGFLFFPGKEEAKSVSVLRLSVSVGGAIHVVNIPLAQKTP